MPKSKQTKSIRRLFTAIFFMVSFLVLPKTTNAQIINDAYTYQDDFNDNNGVVTPLDNFVNTGGTMEATGQNATITTDCIELPQPGSGTFQQWSFIDIDITDLTDTTTSQLEIQDCSSNNLQTEAIAEGINSIDISTITESQIQLVYTVEHTGTPGAGVTAAKVNDLKMYGKSDGVTNLDITSTQTTVDSNSTVAFNIQLNSTGALTPNGVLTVSLDTINGEGDTDTNTNGQIDLGLAQDATVCYDIDNDGLVETDPAENECRHYRPLRFNSAENGPQGETPNTPAVGATTGTIDWNLDDLPDGLSETTSFTLFIPRGYIDQKTLQARATLTFGTESNDTNLNNYQILSDDSQVVTVESALDKTFNFRSWFTSYSVGLIGHDIAEIFNSAGSSVNASDFEGTTVTIHAGNGTCIPEYQNFTINSTGNYPYTVLQEPNFGDSFDAANPLIIKIHRTFYSFAPSVSRIYANYDIPLTCSDGENIISFANATDEGSFDEDKVLSHQIQTVLCRGSQLWLFSKIMSGNEIPNGYDQLRDTGVSTAYFDGGVLRPGEYFQNWLYGDYNKTHTVVLDQTYTVTEIPPGITLNGIRDYSWINGIYKDSDGDALLPTDPGFDYDNPESSGWHLVDMTWTGTPFANLPDDTDPEAVVLPGTRILTMKNDDSPVGVEPDQGVFSIHMIFRGCDGTYGCTQEADGTWFAMDAVSSELYTYYDPTDDAVDNGTAQFCENNISRSAYIETKSTPVILTESTGGSDQTNSGEVYQLDIYPSNHVSASQYPQANWGVNLYEIRDSIDLNGLTGQVVIPAGADIPHADQNVIGQSCDTNNITFHAPDPTICLASTDPTGTDCYAYWEVPTGCQLPNGWGRWSLINYYYDTYHFRLNTPILNTITTGTPLDFNAELRTTDLSQLGADNAVDVSRWSADNFTATTTVTVLASAALNVSETGPSIWPQDSTFSYNLEVENLGNSPNNGLYLVKQLPRIGDGLGTTFTPEYRQIFMNIPTADAIVEYSTESTCFSNPLSGTWTQMSMENTSRAGYQSQTQDNVDSSAICVRTRVEPAGTTQINPNNSILVALDIYIPTGIADNEELRNRSAAGSNSAWGGLDLSLVETNSVITTVGSQTILQLEKNLQIDPTNPNRIRWALNYSNVSPATANNITINDTLPNELIFEQLEPLTSNESCINCTPINTNPDGSGGELSFNITTLTQDDGNPNGGTDQGAIYFYTNVKDTTPQGTTIQNCGSITPQVGIGDTTCNQTTTANISINKDQTTPLTGPDQVPRGETIHYTLTTTNNEANPVYFRFYDILSNEGTYIPGSLRINGATASDSFITNSIIDYSFITQTNPTETATVEYDIQVNTNITLPADIENTALVSHCLDNLDSNSCSPAQQTNQTSAEVINNSPQTNPDIDQTSYNDPIIIDPLSNDTDVDGTIDQSSLTIITPPTNGNATIQNNQITYTPEFGVTGSQTITYEICDNDGDCAQEQITIDVTEPIVYITIEYPTYTVEESYNQNINILLSEPTNQIVTVTYQTQDGTAIAPDDYANSTNTVTFNPAETQQTITIPIVNDDIEEAEEQFNLTLSNPINAQLGDPDSTVITITDPPVIIDPIIDIFTCDDLDIYDVEIEDINQTTVTIKFKTTEKAKTTIRYGTDKDDLNKKEKDDDYETKHEETIKGLKPNTKYYFQIEAEDKCDEDDESKVYSFTTEQEEETSDYPPYIETTDDEEEEEEEEEETTYYPINIEEDGEDEEDDNDNLDSQLQTSLIPTNVKGEGSLWEFLEKIAKHPITKYITNSLVATLSLLSLLLLLSNISTIAQLGTAISRIFALPFYKPKENQGMVYDVDTGQPISLATIAILGKDQKTKETKTTDKVGSYFFLVPKGEYFLKATKKDYRMLSKEEIKKAKVVYQELYHQNKPIQLDQEAMIRYAIPMKKTKQTQSNNLFNQPAVHSMLSMIFYIGFALSILITSFQPNLWNIAITISYIFFFLLRLANFIKPHWGIVEKQHIPQSFAFVNAYTANNTNTPQARAVTDESGRYAFILDKGTYVIQAKSATGEGETTKKLIVKQRGIVGGRVRI